MSSAKMLEMISSMETQLALMKATLGVEVTAVAPVKAKKVKKEKDPNAPKKEANVWIKFTQRVSTLLKQAEINTGAAPVSKQFAAALKGMKPYEEWADSEIVATWATWKKPAESKMVTKRKLSASSAEEAVAEPAAPVESTPKKERKPMTEETKKAAAEKRAATKSAKADSTPPNAPGAPKKAKAPKFYTVQQLRDFDPFDYEGENYAVNVRGDVVDDDSNYVGFWDGATLTRRPPPEDWVEISTRGDEE